MASVTGDGGAYPIAGRLTVALSQPHICQINRRRETGSVRPIGGCDAAESAIADLGYRRCASNQHGGASGQGVHGHPYLVGRSRGFWHPPGHRVSRVGGVVSMATWERPSAGSGSGFGFESITKPRTRALTHAKRLIPHRAVRANFESDSSQQLLLRDGDHSRSQACVLGRVRSSRCTEVSDANPSPGVVAGLGVSAIAGTNRIEVQRRRHTGQQAGFHRSKNLKFKTPSPKILPVHSSSRFWHARGMVSSHATHPPTHIASAGVSSA